MIDKAARRQWLRSTGWSRVSSRGAETWTHPEHTPHGSATLAGAAVLQRQHEDWLLQQSPRDLVAYHLRRIETTAPPAAIETVETAAAVEAVGTGGEGSRFAVSALTFQPKANSYPGASKRLQEQAEESR